VRNMNSAKRLFKKLSAVRATLPVDECLLLDALVLGDLALPIDRSTTNGSEITSEDGTMNLHVTFDQRREIYVVQ
jgi:hypothetical protein